MIRFVSGQRLRRAALYAAGLCCSLFAASSTETAVANGDTRTLNLYHTHTGESIQATFRVNGVYDQAVLDKLNYFLRDWRNNDVTHMDPRLFDVVWEVYRTAGASQPIQVVSAYRSPETNAMLRARSHAVAEFSQHILGKAMDTTMPGMSMEQIREIGMRLQRGGVGYYSRENFVHLDVGNVRYWPRMSYDQLARLFPDGKSVDLASDGRALPRYEEARAEIAARGGIASDAPRPQGGGLFGWLFGNHDREEEAAAAQEVAPARPAQAPTQATTRVALLNRNNAPPVGQTAADRRAARAEAPALAAIDASNAPDSAEAPPNRLNRTQVAALAPVPADPVQLPAPSAARQKLAALTADDETARNSAKDDAASTIAASVAPMPPARPADLVAFADVPTPPSRPSALIHLAALTPPATPDALPAAAPAAKPNAARIDPPEAKPATAGAGKAETTSAETASTETASTDPAKLDPAKADAAGRLARAASLPVVITQGPKDRQALPATALGYAATPGESGAATVPPIVSARLDRSNFSTAISATPTAEAQPASILGQAFTGLRQAARVVPDALSAAPSAGYKVAFNAAAGLLDCAHFTKWTASAPPAPQSSVSISEAAANRSN